MSRSPYQWRKPEVSHDVGLDGATLPLNTLTVFNAALSFRFGWEGKLPHRSSRTVKASLENPQIMAQQLSPSSRKSSTPILDCAESSWPSTAAALTPDNVIDALASFQRTLVTPGSRFDRWLAGDAGALSPEEQDGYSLFKSLGCVSCHQGVNIGGNLFQRHGIFHPLASPDARNSARAESAKCRDHAALFP